MNEGEKRKYYNERIMRVEQGSFTPLVMSATSGMRMLNILCSPLRDDKCFNYITIATWIRRERTFSLIWSNGLCTRGSREIFGSNRLEKSIDDDAHTNELTSRIP